MQETQFFPTASSVQSSRILYTPSGFAKTSLLHLQEIGTLKATAPHTSKREKLNSYLCFVVESGEGELVYEGNTHSLKVGDVVFIDCKKPYSHSTGLAPDKELWSLRWCHFFGPSMAAVYAKYRERGGSPVIQVANRNANAFSELLSKLYLLASALDYIRDMRINELLNQLLTLLMEASWHEETQRNTPKKLELAQIKTYLDEHYREKITLDSISERFYIDKYYMTHLFKEQYGITVNGYLQQVRITQAKQLLRFSDMSIEEIGLECGIGELSYFSRMFKKMEGVSPSSFRNAW